jgi:Cytochrome B6-F complex subunit VI (PetL)
MGKFWIASFGDRLRRVGELPDLALPRIVPPDRQKMIEWFCMQLMERQMAVVAYIALVGGAFGTAMVLFFGLRAVKLI